MKRKSIEHSEQVKLVAYIRAFHPDIIVAAIPNGGNRSATERLRLAHEGVLAGMPDLMVLQPTKGFYGLFIEMKTNIGIMSIKQTALSKQLNDKGYLCLIARSANEGIKLIEDYLRVVDNQSNTQKINKLSVN